MNCVGNVGIVGGAGAVAVAVVATFILGCMEIGCIKEAFGAGSGLVSAALMVTEAKKIQRRFPRAYDRIAQTSENIQNGKIVWDSVSVFNPNSFHIPSSRNIVRGLKYNTTAIPII